MSFTNPKLLTALIAGPLRPKLFHNLKLISSAGVSLSSPNYFTNRTMASSSSGGADKLVVEHDQKQKKFFIKLGDAEAKLEYGQEKEKNGDVVLNMWHTEVPPQLQGKGIAKILAKEAFEYVVENKMKMRLSCSYLQKYFNDNPLDKYKAAVV